MEKETDKKHRGFLGWLDKVAHQAFAWLGKASKQAPKALKSAGRYLRKRKNRRSGKK